MLLIYLKCFLVFLRNRPIALALTVSGLYLPKDSSCYVGCKTDVNRMHFADYQNPDMKKYSEIHLCMKCERYVG